MLLAPIPSSPSFLRFANSTEHIIFTIPDGMNRVVAQLIEHQGSWPSGAVISLDASLDGATFSNFAGGAVTYTSAGLTEAVNVGGVRYIRFRVSTTGGTTQQLMVFVSAWKE